jgi:hypothetical protein
MRMTARRLLCAGCIIDTGGHSPCAGPLVIII